MSSTERKPYPVTEEEKKNPIFKYYTENMTPPNPGPMKILLSGPMDPKDAIRPEQVREMLKPGYMKVETGYCVMEDGGGYLCLNNDLPGVTLEMIKWWFAWHPLEDLRYKIWNPYCHAACAVDEADRKKIKDISIPLENKIADVVHHIAEDVGGGLEDIEIHFKTPEFFGFSKEELREAHSYVIAGCGLAENREHGNGKLPVVMFHYYREIEGGIETRTRCWMGDRMEAGRSVCVLPEGAAIPIEAPKGLALHNVEEFGHLASFLPDLYAEYGKKPF